MYSRFLDLNPEQRRLLVGAMVVADASPDIIDVDQSLQAELRLAAEPHAVPALTERLLGWWYHVFLLEFIRFAGRAGAPAKLADLAPPTVRRWVVRIAAADGHRATHGGTHGHAMRY